VLIVEPEIVIGIDSKIAMTTSTRKQIKILGFIDSLLVKFNRKILAFGRL